MREQERGKITINANPAGILEIEEFKNRMAQFRKGKRVKVRSKK